MPPPRPSPSCRPSPGWGVPREAARSPQVGLVGTELDEDTPVAADGREGLGRGGWGSWGGWQFFLRGVSLGHLTGSTGGGAVVGGASVLAWPLPAGPPHSALCGVIHTQGLVGKWDFAPPTSMPEKNPPKHTNPQECFTIRGNDFISS